MNESSSVTMRVPASSANCGPGFDALGIALTLYNFVRIDLASGGEEVRGLGQEPFPADTMAMVRDAARNFCAAAGVEPHGFGFDIWGAVPSARGLGSSAAIRVGILGALNRLHGHPLDDRQLIGLGSHLDRAPDGIAACVLGGFCVSRLDPATDTYLDTLRFPVDESLAFVTVSPAHEVLTARQRQVLPVELPFADAVRTLNSAAFLVAAFAQRDYERLRHAVADFVHQPYRERLCPFTREAIAAGTEAGAYAGWLSGSGSTVVCVAPEKAAGHVGAAMMEVFRNGRAEAHLYTLKADNEGMREEVEAR